MYPVTDDFQIAISDPKNRKVYGKIIVDYTSTSLDESIGVEVNDIANVSYPSQISDSVREPSSKILSLDGSWIIDGTFHFAPLPSEVSKYQMGWWGSKLSNSNGNFDGDNPIISISFTQRPILKLVVVGDRFRNEFPIDFIIRLYNGDDTLLETYNISDNDSIIYDEKLYNIVTEVSRMELEIIKWNKPNRQVKILEFYTAIRETYEMDDIMSIDLVEQRTSSMTGLPIGSITNSELRVKLNNDDGRFDIGNKQSPLYELLLPNRRISGYLGTSSNSGEIEYVPLGTFWVDKWSVPNDTSHVEITSRDKLKFLEESEFTLDDVLLNISIYDFAKIILLDAGLMENEILIDDIFKSKIIPVVGKFEKVSHRELLRKLTEVALGQVYTNRDGIIVLEDIYPLSENINISVNDENVVSKKEQVIDSVLESNSNYLMLNGSTTLSNNNQLIRTDGLQQVGWINNTLSDENGDFEMPYPKISLNFMPKSINSVYFTGDSYRNEYPVDFNIRLYDEFNNILAERNIIGNSELNFNINIEENPINVARIDLEILKWNVPNELVKIIEFMGGEFKLYITDDEYFHKDNPLEYDSLANVIDVEVIPMSIEGERLDSYYITAKDEDSIIKHGLKKFTVSGNDFIQTDNTAMFIAKKLLEVYKSPQRTISMKWRGNPALMLGNLVRITDEVENNNIYRISSQSIKYNGVLSSDFNAIRDYD